MSGSEMKDAKPPVPEETGGRPAKVPLMTGADFYLLFVLLIPVFAVTNLALSVVFNVHLADSLTQMLSGMGER